MVRGNKMACEVDYMFFVCLEFFVVKELVADLVSFMFGRRLRRFLVRRRERMDSVEMLRCWCCGCDSNCFLWVCWVCWVCWVVTWWYKGLCWASSAIMVGDGG